LGSPDASAPSTDTAVLIPDTVAGDADAGVATVGAGTVVAATSKFAAFRLPGPADAARYPTAALAVIGAETVRLVIDVEFVVIVTFQPFGVDGDATSAPLAV